MGCFRCLPRHVGMIAAACIVALVPSGQFAPAQQAPVLSQMSPTEGSPGDAVTITGEKFGATQGKSSVKFAGVPATVKLWSDAAIVVVIPTAAAPGSAEVLLTIDKVKEEHPGAFTVQAASHLNPSEGPPGTLVTISGAGFGTTQGTNEVLFGGKEVTAVRYWSPSQIVIATPDMGFAQDVTFSVAVKIGKAATSEGEFNLVPAAAQTATAPASKGSGTPSSPATTTPPAAKPPSAKIDPPTGKPSTPVTITGSGFGQGQGNGTVKFNGITATVETGKWLNTSIVADAPDEHAAGNVDLTVDVFDGNGKNLGEGGSFTETPLPTATLNPDTGAALATVRIIGTGFGTTQGSVTFGGQTATVIGGTWSDTEIDVTAPDLKAGATVHSDVAVLDTNKKQIADAGTFTETIPAATMSPVRGVAGTTVTINGAGLPQSQGNDKVLFTSIDGGKELPGTIPASGWAATGITVQVPDFHRSANAPLAVAVVDQNNQVVTTVTPPAPVAPVAVGAVPPYFTEVPPKWGDLDEKPVSIKIVGGYEQGWQSSQAGTSDAFLTIYGHSLFLNGPIGPFYGIRLLTAPQASGTYGVVSVLTNPSGTVTTQNLTAVGQAVDLNLGLEYKVPKALNHGQTTASLIAGGGFVTPLQANSISATFTMPPFGTVECTELQSRLTTAGIFKQAIYSGVMPNTAPGSTSCFSNITTSTPVAITQLQYAAPNQPNFFPKYFAGARLIDRFPGTTTLKQCDESNPCERGYFDFTLGQNASISGGKLHEIIFNIDSIYPLPVPSLNFIYLFGSISRRLGNLPPNLSPLVLTVPTTGTLSPPNAADLVLPLTQPDSDFYRIGVGVSICQIFSALTTKPASGASATPCKF